MLPELREQPNPAQQTEPHRQAASEGGYPATEAEDAAQDERVKPLLTLTLTKNKTKTKTETPTPTPIPTPTPTPTLTPARTLALTPTLTRTARR